MLHRAMQFLPSILIIASIGILTRVYLEIIFRRNRERLESIEWCKNNQKTLFFFSLPFRTIFAPIIEELIFRAPLIIAFGSVTKNAWWAIATSSLLFSAIHWPGNKILLSDVYDVKKKDATGTDNVSDAVKELAMNPRQRRQTIRRKVIQVAVSFTIGIVCSYYGIRYQSIYVSVGLHSGWNLLGADILAIMLALVLFGYYGIQSLYEGIRFRLRRARLAKCRG